MQPQSNPSQIPMLPNDHTPSDNDVPPRRIVVAHRAPSPERHRQRPATLHDLPTGSDRLSDLPIGAPLWCDARRGRSLTIHEMKGEPDRFAALIVGQLPPSVDSNTLLVVFQHLLRSDRELGPDPVICAFDRFKPNCGTLWVPRPVYRQVKEVLDCKCRIAEGSVLHYATAKQPDVMSLRRITCEVKHNIQQGNF